LVRPLSCKSTPAKPEKFFWKMSWGKFPNWLMVCWVC